MNAPSPKSVKAAAPAPRGRLKDFSDLKAVKLDIELRTRLAQELEAARQAAAAKAKAEKELFSRAVGPVKALPPKHRPGHRAHLPVAQAAPIAVQHQLDELAVMREAISDEFDVESLLDTDDALSFRRPRHGPRRDAQTAPRRLEHSGPDRPARPAPRRCPGKPEPVHQGRPQDRLALRACGARQGPGVRPARPRCSRAACKAG